MEMLKVILWKEIKKEISSVKKILGYIIILCFSLYSYNRSKLLLQEIFCVGYGIYLVSFVNSKNFYANISSLLSLPISIKEYCICRTLCNCIKLLAWEFVNVLLLFLLCNCPITDMISLKFVIVFILYHVYLIQVMFISECLMIRFGTKHIYFILALSGMLMVLIQMALEHAIPILNLVVQLCIIIFTIYMNRKLIRFDNETILRRWT